MTTEYTEGTEVQTGAEPDFVREPLCAPTCLFRPMASGSCHEPHEKH